MPTSTSTVRKMSFFSGWSGTRLPVMRPGRIPRPSSTSLKRELGMSVRIALSDDRPKVALMVSKADHCFHDLVLRVPGGRMECGVRRRSFQS